jgi:hypothetical protein
VLRALGRSDELAQPSHDDWPLDTEEIDYAVATIKENGGAFCLPLWEMFRMVLICLPSSGQALIDRHPGDFERSSAL